MKKLYGADPDFISTPLFGDDTVADRSSDTTSDNGKKDKKVKKGTKRGKSDSVPEPADIRQDDNKDGKHAEKSDSGTEVDKKHRSTNGVRAKGRGQGTSGKSPKENKRGSGKGTEKNSGDKPGVVRYEIEDPEEHKRREKGKWTETDSLMAPYRLRYAPVENTRKFNISKVVVNDKVYEVSTSSIKDGYYVQGLDSNFLITYYRPYKKTESKK